MPSVKAGCLLLAGICAVTACSEPKRADVLAGTWMAEFWLDSVATGPQPAVKVVRGEVEVAEIGLDSIRLRPDTMTTVSLRFGEFRVDYMPMILQVTMKVTGAPPVPPSTADSQQADVWQPRPDSVVFNFRPGVEIGGLETAGHIHGDTLDGRWRARGLCCGAHGRVRMVRVSTVIPEVKRTPVSGKSSRAK